MDEYYIRQEMPYQPIMTCGVCKRAHKTVDNGDGLFMLIPDCECLTPAASPWMPMDSAPKDGTPILALCLEERCDIKRLGLLVWRTENQGWAEYLWVISGQPIMDDECLKDKEILMWASINPPKGA